MKERWHDGTLPCSNYSSGASRPHAGGSLWAFLSTVQGGFLSASSADFGASTDLPPDRRQQSVDNGRFEPTFMVLEIIVYLRLCL
jgi:hypothetical protein